jgi:hypothetical protein
MWLSWLPTGGGGGFSPRRHVTKHGPFIFFFLYAHKTPRTASITVDINIILVTIISFSICCTELENPDSHFPRSVLDPDPTSDLGKKWFRQMAKSSRILSFCSFFSYTNVCF